MLDKLLRQLSQDIAILAHDLIRSFDNMHEFLVLEGELHGGFGDGGGVALPDVQRVRMSLGRTIPTELPMVVT